MPKNKITLLNECVAQEDSYKNGTHQKIADTLHHLIESENEAITIGLEGEWGTGKSTVINLLEKKINNGSDDKTLFFKFDAWSHDGDPLRITFLEKLIRQIKNELIADKTNKEAQKKLDELLIKTTEKVKTITNTSVKTSTKFGKLLAASIMLVPIGSALFSKSYDYKNTFFIPYKILQEIASNGTTHHILETIKSFALIPTTSALLLLAPLLLVLYWIFFGKGKDSMSDKWEFISSNSKEKVVQDIIEQGDKTSFEFERIFAQTIDLTVGDNNPFSKIIIVIDNMDRVSHDHAKNIWSTLQVFITNNNQKSKLMWFIIPFDESAFKKIWPNEKLDDDDHHFTSNSFTEKCFQLVIDVPTPITSDWIHYLTRMANNAFSKWETSDLADNFIRQYKDYFSTVNHSPTPRSINNIINQVQALQIRFHKEKEITINAITIYSLLRRTKSKSEIKNMILYPQKSECHESTLKRVKLYQRELSSILYHIPYDRGLELILGEEISRIIKSDNEDQYKRLTSLQKENEDAFWQAWDYNYQLPETGNSSSIESINKSEVFLHIVTNYLFDVRNHEPIKIYTQEISKSFSNDIKILLRDYGMKRSHDYIKKLLKLSEINEVDTEIVISSISISIKNHIFDKQIKPSFNYMEENNSIDLTSIRGLIDSLKIRSILCDTINNLDTFNAWCTQQEDFDVEIPEILPKETAFKDITSQFFSNDYLNPKIINKMLSMAKSNPKWEGWDNAIENICNWAKRPNNKMGRSASSYHSVRSIDKDSLYFSLVHTLNCNSNARVKHVISELLSNKDFISGLYYEFLENKRNESLARLILPLIENKEFTPQADVMNEIKKYL